MSTPEVPVIGLDAATFDVYRSAPEYWDEHLETTHDTEACAPEDEGRSKSAFEGSAISSSPERGRHQAGRRGKLDSVRAWIR